jgi:hypothetical protein
VVGISLDYHVTQRGNGRAQTFFGDIAYALHCNVLAERCRAAGERMTERSGKREPKPPNGRAPAASFIAET